LTIDLFFIADVFLSFRTAYYTPQGELEHRTKNIWKNYLKTWFPVDFAACLPVNYVAYLDQDDFRDDTAYENGAVDKRAQPGGRANKIIRLIRLLRLLKLLRLARVNRLVQRYEQEFYQL
jgi:hyperpolarization activated cyclic nucleotide-gated potassium channel 2